MLRRQILPNAFGPRQHPSSTQLSQVSLNAPFHIEMSSAISVRRLRDVLEPIRVNYFTGAGCAVGGKIPFRRK